MKPVTTYYYFSDYAVNKTGAYVIPLPKLLFESDGKYTCSIEFFDFDGNVLNLNNNKFNKLLLLCPEVGNVLFLNNIQCSCLAFVECSLEKNRKIVIKVV